jgi:hypothetical protein
MRIIYGFAYLAFGLNLTLALVVLATGQSLVAEFPMAVPWILFVSLMSFLMIVLAFVWGRGVTNGQALFLFFGQGLSLVLLYAGFYFGTGLASSGEVQEVNRLTALYFSLVTWTTLGYGDFAPADGARLLAASQGVMGLLFFGIFVGIAVNVIVPRLK